MVALQLPIDTTGTKLLWKLIEQLSHDGGNLSPTTGNGYGVAWQALVVLLVLLILAVVSLSIVIGWVFVQWRKDQKAGVRALASSKDATRKEITEILKTELGNSRAANLSDIARIEQLLGKLGGTIGHIVLDVAIIGHKLKLPIRSSPTEVVTKDPPKEGG